MGLRMSFKQFFKPHASVDLRRIETLVSQDRLNRANVGPVVVHQRRHRVPKDVTSARLLNPSPLKYRRPYSVNESG